MFARVAEAYDVLSDGASALLRPTDRPLAPPPSRAVSHPKSGKDAFPSRVPSDGATPSSTLDPRPLTLLLPASFLPPAGKRKATFDLYGESGLKDGAPDGRGGKKGGFYAFEVSPLSVFETFFGTANPYGALMDISDAFERLTATPDEELGMQRTFDLGVTLEELHHGAHKSVSHVRKTLTDAGDVVSETRTLRVSIPPGCENGRRFVFEGEGNVRPGLAAGPVVYAIATAKHPVFQRSGDDLVYVARVPLIDGLCGTTLEIPTLDKRTLRIPVADVVDAGSQKVVVGEGMARRDGPKGARGDLIVVFDLVFPRTMTPTRRDLMRAAFFFPGKNPGKEATNAAHAFLNAAQHGVKGWMSQGK